MQSHRWQPDGSSGVLDVFGATRYFAGHAHNSATVAQLAAERLTQGKVVMHDTGMAESFRCQDDDLRHAQELELAKLAGKSNKLAAFFGSMVSPSPGASFRRRPPPTSGSTAAGDEPKKVSSSTTSSRESADDSSVQLEGRGYGVDLGVATGDRRLQGVKVVRGGGGDEQRWVVRCTSCWHQEEQHAAEMLYAEGSSDDHRDQAKDDGEDGANPGDWESDSSSDLFDLDIDYVHL